MMRAVYHIRHILSGGFNYWNMLCIWNIHHPPEYFTVHLMFIWLSYEQYTHSSEHFVLDTGTCTLEVAAYYIRHILPLVDPIREASEFTGWVGGSQRNSLWISQITLFPPHFYTTYYLAPKESKNFDGPISFAPPNDASDFVRPPLTTRPKIFAPPLTQKLKVPKTPQKH